MDLPKFISMIASRSLYFCRADKLGDPYEGTVSRTWVRDSASQMADHLLLDTNRAIDWIRTRMLINASVGDELPGTSMRDITLVSCWHRSRYESDAMWSKYAPNGQGIAIRSTVGRLEQSLVCPEPVFIGNVRYDGHEEHHTRNALQRVLSKRVGFAHEREFRAISIVQHEWEEGSTTSTPPAWWHEGENGTNYDIDVEKLVASVVVSPAAPEWYKETVNFICESANLKVRAVSSEMTDFDATPNPEVEIQRLVAAIIIDKLNVKHLPGGGLQWGEDAEA